MFYIMYLTGLCHRRHWPDPTYECHRTRHGYTCTVRVNNREYTSDTEYETDELARNAAATRAYMICRNFSVNDGMYPGQRQGQGGVIQGLPVAIGTGRRRSTYSQSNGYESGGSNYADGGSGGSSPRSSDSELDMSVQLPDKETSGVCFCGRAEVAAYGRCLTCLQENGWH